MAANNSDQRGQQGGINNQEGGSTSQGSDPNSNEQTQGNRQEVSKEQSGRLESQPGNMSGVSIENQRSQSANQDLASRGSDMESTESLK